MRFARDVSSSSRTPCCDNRSLSCGGNPPTQGSHDWTASDFSSRPRCCRHGGAPWPSCNRRRCCDGIATDSACSGDGGPGQRAPNRLYDDTIKLISEMAARNRLWGAERIRGELLKIGFRVSKRTVQKYMRRLHRPDKGQKWSTFVRNHAHDIWCCDFVQAYDLLFRPVFLFFIVNQGSREVVHTAATPSPTQE